MKKLVLAISGKRVSGKDTLAALLVAHAARAGRQLAPYAFAAESKRMLVEERAALGDPLELERLLHDRTYKELHRPALTAFTVAALSRDPLVFCRSVCDRIASSADDALVTDVRLRVEVAHLRERFDLHLVRIARSDAARAASGWARTDAADEHPTETELDDPSLWDEVITNDGSLDELDAAAARLASEHHARVERASAASAPT